MGSAWPYIILICVEIEKMLTNWFDFVAKALAALHRSKEKYTISWDIRAHAQQIQTEMKPVEQTRNNPNCKANDWSIWWAAERLCLAYNIQLKLVFGHSFLPFSTPTKSPLLSICIKEHFISFALSLTP